MSGLSARAGLMGLGVHSLIWLHASLFDVCRACSSFDGCNLPGKPGAEEGAGQLLSNDVPRAFVLLPCTLASHSKMQGYIWVLSLQDARMHMGPLTPRCEILGTSPLVHRALRIPCAAHRALHANTPGSPLVLPVLTRVRSQPCTSWMCEQRGPGPCMHQQ